MFVCLLYTGEETKHVKSNDTFKKLQQIEVLSRGNSFVEKQQLFTTQLKSTMPFGWEDLRSSIIYIFKKNFLLLLYDIHSRDGDNFCRYASQLLGFPKPPTNSDMTEDSNSSILISH